MCRWSLNSISSYFIMNFLFIGELIASNSSPHTNSDGTCRERGSRKFWKHSSWAIPSLCVSMGLAVWAGCCVGSWPLALLLLNSLQLIIPFGDWAGEIGEREGSEDLTEEEESEKEEEDGEVYDSRYGNRWECQWQTKSKENQEENQ